MVPVLHVCPTCKRLYQLDPRSSDVILRQHFADPFGASDICTGSGLPPLPAKAAGLVVHLCSQRARSVALACCGETPAAVTSGSRPQRVTSDRAQVTCRKGT
jgi:hypothetical protein